MIRYEDVPGRCLVHTRSLSA